MKPLRESAIVEVNLSQKDTHSVIDHNGKEVKIWIGKKYNPNGRESNPVLCKVLNINSKKFPYLQAGDTILVHHNYFEKPDTSRRCIEKNAGTQIATFTIPVDQLIYAKIGADGDVHPVCDNVIAERVKKPSQSDIIIMPFEKEEETRVVVKKVAPEVDEVAEGDEVFILKYGDMPISYNWGGREREVIKVWREDIIAINNTKKLDES